jgi:hypothetical protein
MTRTVAGLYGNHCEADLAVEHLVQNTRPSASGSVSMPERAPKEPRRARRRTATNTPRSATLAY